MFISMENFSILSVAHAGVITDAPSLATVLLRASEFLLQTIGTVMAIAFVCAGLLYLFSGGNEKILQTAKKWTLYIGLGCLVVFGALILLSTFESFFA